MTDNKNARDGRDRSKVGSKGASVVEYLHSQHPEFTHQQIVDAIAKAGPVRADIEAYLRQQKGKK